MYYRKTEEAKRRKRLSGLRNFPNPWYYDERKQRWVRLYRGSTYTENKRIARRMIRRYTNKIGVYSKNYDDLWWNTW